MKITNTIDKQSHRSIVQYNRQKHQPINIDDYMPYVVTESGYKVTAVGDDIDALNLKRPLFVEVHADDLMLRSWSVLNKLANHNTVSECSWMTLCEDTYGVKSDFDYSKWSLTYKGVDFHTGVKTPQLVRKMESLLGFIKTTEERAQWTDKSLVDFINNREIGTNKVYYRHYSGIHTYSLRKEDERYDGTGKFLSYESLWNDCIEDDAYKTQLKPTVIVTHSWIDMHPHHFMSLLKILDYAGDMNVPVVMLSPNYSSDTQTSMAFYQPVSQTEMYAHLGAFTTTYISQVMRNPYVYERTIQKSLSNTVLGQGMYETYKVYKVNNGN